ncbi:MAG: phage portal protein, partial [Actinomycetota bacterium]|nr:phage portal protein [Actinomycetota bacterium]
ATYAEIYRQQLWVHVVVRKRAKAQARLPLKVYERNSDGRREVPEHPYAQLLRRPNERQSKTSWWRWMRSTRDIYGESFAGKIRDRGGRPVQLVPLHPTSMHAEEEDNGEVRWTFQNGRVRVENIPTSDLIHLKDYHPDSTVRGLSTLEPLRRTLENEDAARRATSSFWKRGARPATALIHPGTLGGDADSRRAAAQRLKMQWDQIAAGADNTGSTVVLEEGMKPEVLSLSAEEAQYIESRKLNREEVCGAFDVPPPVVHILDRATFSNITEQMRSMYRDTMAPLLGEDEEDLDFQLRGSVRPGASEPDFGDDVYAEFLLDEVLRGDFEVRADAYQKAINSGWMKPEEVRQKENLPPAAGADRLLVNSTMVPIEDAGRSAPTVPAQRGLDSHELRTLMGRLSRQQSLSEVDPDALTMGLNGAGEAVKEALALARAHGEDVAAFRQRLKTMEER